MAFIVDLVIIMYRVFNRGQPIGKDGIEEVIEEFKADTLNEVHMDIRRFMARHGTFGAVTKKDKVFEKMKDLIYMHTTRQDGIGVGTVSSSVGSP